jgi:hypothetical protein
MSSFSTINFSNAKEARQTLGPLAQALVQIPANVRANVWENVLDALSEKPAEARERGQTWARYIPATAAALTLRPDIPYTLVRTISSIDAARKEDALLWYNTLLAAMRPYLTPEADLSGPGRDLRLTVPLGLALAGDDYASFERIALVAFSHSFDHSIDQIHRAVDILRQFPILCSAFSRIFHLQPHRCMDLAIKIGLASQLGREALAPLGYLEGNALDSVMLPNEWRALIAAAPAVAEPARSYLLAQRVRGAGEAVPPGVRKALEQPQRLAGELGYLEERLAEDPTRTNLRARADSLRSRLANNDKLMEEMRIEIEERLAQAGAEAHIACAEMKTLECYRVRLRSFAGPFPDDLPITDDLANATLLLGDIDVNRKLLIRLLRGYLRGDRRPLDRHPGNVRFLARLAEAGIDTGVWLAGNPRKFPCRGVVGGKVRLRLERDPLGVLQMGNYFDTCLSFGRFNSFATVANACELNKRVVYAYDTLDRVVGRKLIGITGDGKLIGFYTYSTLGDDAGKDLRAIFRRYCIDLARRCGLEMADSGTIPRLFAEQWYDDGAVPWSEAEDEQTRERRSRDRSAPAHKVELDAPVSAVL